MRADSGPVVKREMRVRDPGLAWLATLKVYTRPWNTLAISAGALQAVAVLAQSALFAWLLHQLIIERRPFAELNAVYLALPAVFIGRALAGWLKDEAGLRASVAVRQRVRAMLVDQLWALGPGWVAQRQGGALASQVLEQVESLDGYFARYRPQQMLAVLVPLIILGAVFPLSWGAGLILLVTAPLIPLFMAIVGYGARARQTHQLQALARMSGQFLDTLRGLTTLKLLDAHVRQAERVECTSDDFRVRTMSVLRIAFMSGAVLEFFASLAIALAAVYFGFSLLGYLDFGMWGDKLELQLAFFVLLLAPEFYLPLRELGTHYHARAEAIAAAGELQPILAADSLRPAGGSAPPAAGAPAISLEAVDFEHMPGVPVLRGLSLSVPAAGAIGIVGVSGSGKTTLLRLLLGELRPAAGRVSLGGQPLDDLDLSQWRERIGWMSQHPRLMAATLAENLRVARHDANDDEMIAALDFAGLADWFAGLEQGLATPLGEGGRQMSGGQLRRLALARLSLRNADLLLLDEPTASLDHESEQRVLAGIARLRVGRTLILLSHRPEPLRLVDRVWVLRDGALGALSPADSGDASTVASLASPLMRPACP